MSSITSSVSAASPDLWHGHDVTASRRRNVRRRDRFGWQDAIAYLLAASVLTLSAVLPALLGRY